MGKELEPLSDQFKTDELKVKGCQSQVWLKAESKENGEVVFIGESDSMIAQGLLAILIRVYSGKKPNEILEIKPLFLEEIGLKKHLSPNRANGVFSMVRQIFLYAQAFSVLQK